MAKSNISIIEATRLLNSTPLGRVATEYTVRRIMNDYGLHAPRLMVIGARILKERSTPGPSQEAKHRARERDRSAEMSASGRNIGDIPDVVDPERRAACEFDLSKFIKTYAFMGKKPFSRSHYRVMKRIESCVFNGGRFIEAVFRGFGKSTISELAAVWVTAYGHKSFVPIIAANETMASEILKSIKGTLSSEELLEDFPEICHAIEALEGISQRAHGQLHNGKLTNIEWGTFEIVLPMIEGSVAGGSVIVARGITSSKIRGMKKRRQDGVIMRPDFFLLDDLQDPDSASNPATVKKRLGIIRKDIIKSAGHFGKISIIMPCTVMAKDDIPDQLLDHKLNPAWQGERIPMVEEWADLHEEFWLGEYRDVRINYDPKVLDDQIRARKEATALYKLKRKEADAGMVVAWEHCYNEEEGEISANQHAYNALIDDGEEVFASEFQNTPLESEDEVGQLKKEEIVEKINRMKRGEVPRSCEVITEFIDIQGACFYWMIIAWANNFTGYVIDYGVFPDQRKKYFRLREVHRTLKNKYPGKGTEGAWRAGLDELTALHLKKEYERDDGVILRVSRCLIDANDGNAMETVFDFCRQSEHPGIVMPSRGRGVTAGNLPFRDYKKKPGDKISDHNWRIPVGATRKAVRNIIFDTNFWKSFVRTRFRTAIGDPGSLSVFGKNPEDISMFSDHMISEFSTRTEGRGRKVDEWKIRPNMENHYWDGVVGCAVAASEQGIREAGERETTKQKKKSKSMSQRQAEARARRTGR